MKLWIRDILIGTAVALLYFIGARFGLMMHPVSGFAALVWPPAGIAVAGVLLFGYRQAIAVFFGCCMVNYWFHDPIGVVLMVSAGNALESLVIAWLLNSLDFKRSFERLKDVFIFICVAVPVNALVGSTIGVLLLSRVHSNTFEGYFKTWAAWAGATSMSDILFTPFFLALAHTKVRVRPKFFRLVEVTALFLLLSAFSFVVFRLGLELWFLVFPIIVWAALRFGLTGSQTTVILAYLLFSWSLQEGYQSYDPQHIRSKMYVILSFLTLTSVTGMILAATIEEKKRAIRSRDEFFSVMSHELKTPVTALSLHVEMTEMEIMGKDKPSSQRLAEVFAISKKQVNRLDNLIQNLLDVSRIEKGGLGFSFIKLNFSEFLETKFIDFKEDLLSAGCAIECSIQKNVHMEVDPARIEQVLNNVSSNIVKYAPLSKVRFSFVTKNGEALLKIEDDGPGISKNFQPLIFEQFKRDRGTRAVSGVGLGLYIIREIIKGHRGQVNMITDISEGVSLTMSLPLQQS